MRTRPLARALAVVTVVLPGLVLTTLGTARPAAPAAPPGSSEPAPVLTFVSAPDLLNADVADVRPAREGRGWEEGDPNSWNEHYAAAVEKVFGTIASHDPDAVLVAGDLVEGHWGIDHDRSGIFGPVNNLRQRKAAVRRAGNVYYGAWRSFFAQAGISPNRVFPAIGDHEIGDNPWRAKSFKHRAFNAFKGVWARHFTTWWGKGHRFGMRPRGTRFEKTAYARWLAPDVLLVTVDVFKRKKSGVVANVTGGQLRWLKQVVGRASPEQTVIVQGHTPAVGPVRATGSSQLFLRRGADNPFWRFIATSGKVDFYFAGEMHEQTARQVAPGSTVQVTHGGLFAHHGTNFLVGRVYPDGRTELESHDFPTVREGLAARLWQTSKKRPLGQITYGDAVNTGGLTLDSGVVTDSWGDLSLNPAVPLGLRPAR